MFIFEQKEGIHKEINYTFLYNCSFCVILIGGSTISIGLRQKFGKQINFTKQKKVFLHNT